MPQILENNPTLASDDFSRKCASIAGLVFLVLDAASIFDRECTFIFKSPVTRVKFLYLFARYFGLASQIITVFYVTGPLATPPVASETCRKWFLFRVITLVSLQASIEAILVLRVYALYKKSSLVGCILTAIVLVETGLCLYWRVYAINVSEYGATCVIISTPREVMRRIGGCVVVTQSAIWSLAICKFWRGLREGWADIPVVSIAVRDGSSTFIAIIAMFAVVVPVSLRVKNIVHIAFPLAMPFLSVVACRLILNMQDLRQSRPELADVELTSALDMSFVESRRSLETIFGATSNIP